MSLVEHIQHPVIDDLIATSDNLEWIPYEQITEIKSSQIDTVHYAIRKKTCDDGSVNETMIMLRLIGSHETCTPTFMSEFAREYSLMTHKDNDVSQFARYSKWLKSRNELIIGFTEHDNTYYMVANKVFYHCYSRYGFCSACGILRCSPVWCICGHKELSDGWTSNNKQLDELIKKSQMQTKSANEAYLEWIPFDCIERGDYAHLYSLPAHNGKLIPLKINHKTNSSYYNKVNYSIKHYIFFYY